MNKKSKKSIIIGISTLMLVMLTLLGLTYAYYRTRVIGNKEDKSISVSNKKAEIVYEDGTASFSTGSEDVLIEPGFTFTKTFHVLNTGEEDVTYSVILDEVNNGFNRIQDWIITLSKNGTEVISENDKVNLVSGSHQVLLGNETISAPTDGDEVKNTYVLTLKYLNSDENQSEDMGASLSLRVNIGDEAYTWNSAPDGSLIASIKNNTQYVEPSQLGIAPNTTIPGRAESLTTEAIISSTEDDYGTSYYYRGNVLNNYVNYAGMCWRIVRIQGDGTIKLALADENNECDDVEGNDKNNNGTYYSVDNTKSGLINGGNTTNFPAVEDELEIWKIKVNNHRYLTNTGWCVDQYPDVPATSSETDVNVYHSTYKRLGDRSTATPTLKCNYEDTGLFNRNIGVLTADEIAFSGAVVGGTSTSNYYLKTNASSYATSSMAYFLLPMSYDYFVLSYVFEASSTGLSDIEPTSTPVTIRPAIVLASNVVLNIEIANQNGTYTNPYVIG